MNIQQEFTNLKREVELQGKKLSDLEELQGAYTTYIVSLQEQINTLQKHSKNPSSTLPDYQPGNPIIEVDKEQLPLNEYTTEELDNNFKNVNDNFKLMDEWQTKAEERFKLLHAELGNRPGGSDIRNLEAKIENLQFDIDRIKDIQDISTENHQNQLLRHEKRLNSYNLWVWVVMFLSIIQIVLNFLTFN